MDEQTMKDIINLTILECKLLYRNSTKRDSTNNKSNHIGM